MSFTRWAVVLVLLLAVRTTPACGQESSRESDQQAVPVDSVHRLNTASIIFDKNLNTFNWIGRLAVDTVVALTRIGIASQYLSNIIQTEGAPAGSSRISESTQQTLRLSLAHPVAEPVAIRTQWSSLVYSDNRGIGLSNASNHILLAGADITPWPFITLTPLAGYRWDRQGTIQDRGLSLDLGAAVHNIDLDGYAIAGDAHFRRDRLDPRLLEYHTARTDISKSFTPESQDSLSFGYFRSRREFYLYGDSAIESRTDQVFTVSNMLSYDVSRSFGADVFVAVQNRGLDKDERRLIAASASKLSFDTRIEEFRLDAFVQTWYRSPDASTSAHLRLGYSERDESHRAKSPEVLPPNIGVLFAERNREEQTKDNIARRVALSGGVSLPLSSSDRFFFSGSAAILRYDTPSDLNREDRDESLIALTAGSFHHFTRALDIGVTVDATMSHLVYLLKERSANNNINHVLRLTPRTVYRPAPWFSTHNAFEVLANYTVYDYEGQVALAKSFSYRQFSWIDSTRVDLTHSVGLDFYAYLKLYERGMLKWDEFVERTENSMTDRTFVGQVRFSPNIATVFAVGIRYFSQSRYLFENTVKKLDTFFSSVGPTCSIQWDVGPHSRLAFQGWYERRKHSDGTIRSLASMTMNVFLHF
jgi:hypothetical protein